jgi:hypothetical protein
MISERSGMPVRLRARSAVDHDLSWDDMKLIIKALGSHAGETDQSAGAGRVGWRCAEC